MTTASGPPMYLAIELTDGSVENLRITEQGPIFIGRDPTCHVVLPSPDVSRRHVALKASGDEVRLTDKSANGTYVGEAEERVLHSTVIIGPDVPFRVGPYRLRVLHAPQRQSAAPPERKRPPVMEPTAPESTPPERQIDFDEATAAAPLRTQKPEGPKTGKYSYSGTAQVTVPTRRKIHRLLLDHLDLATLDRARMDEITMRPRVREALARICRELQSEIPAGVDISGLIEEISDEALGLGPLERLLADETVTEIMVVDPGNIFIERAGRIEHTDLRFTDDDSVRACIERIVTPLGRRIDESTPLVDARLKDGSRVNAVIPPLALRGPCITIRKFSKKPLTIESLIASSSVTEPMARFLTRSVTIKKNIVISGGTGSGKTTLLNVLAGAIPSTERIVTIEDAAELRLPQQHVVAMEARPPNMEGRGEVSIRDLVKNALRMRPDRIVVGECRGGEALDMLQAMNTGHEGTMTTTHANSPREALSRLETLCLMSGLDLPARAIREQVGTSIHLIVQQTRFSDGSRKITAISEVTGLDDEGQVTHEDIFRFHRTGMGEGGAVMGEFRATGYMPSFVDEFITHGLATKGNYL